MVSECGVLEVVGDFEHAAPITDHSRANIKYGDRFIGDEQSVLRWSGSEFGGKTRQDKKYVQVRRGIRVATLSVAEARATARNAIKGHCLSCPWRRDGRAENDGLHVLGEPWIIKFNPCLVHLETA